MIVCFVGDVDRYLADIAKQYSASATLFTHSSQLINNQTFYTSLADCDSTRFFQLLEASDEIHYCPPTRWSDSDIKSIATMKFWTEKFLDFFLNSRQKKIIGYVPTPSQIDFYDSSKYLDLKASRKSLTPQIWIVGCSISHGIGVSDSQRFGDILQKKLDMPVSWLTFPGSSITWAADQIIRSNIKKDDLIFWGMTTVARFPFYQEGIKHVNPRFYEQHPEFDKIISINRLDDENQIYQSVTSVFRAENFCNKVRAKLFMLDMFGGNENPIRYYCKGLKNFDFVLKENDYYIDKGTDGAHPGPLQHEIYANKFIKMMEVI